MGEKRLRIAATTARYCVITCSIRSQRPCTWFTTRSMGLGRHENTALGQLGARRRIQGLGAGHQLHLLEQFPLLFVPACSVVRVRTGVLLAALCALWLLLWSGPEKPGLCGPCILAVQLIAAVECASAVLADGVETERHLFLFHVATEVTILLLRTADVAGLHAGSCSRPKLAPLNRGAIRTAALPSDSASPPDSPAGFRTPAPRRAIRRMPR